MSAEDVPEKPRPAILVPKVSGVLEIDGELDDSAWSNATLIDSLKQVEPNEGLPSDPPTAILLMRDHEHLYIGFICYEPEPEQMVLQDMHRDAYQRDDDAVKIALDTFRDGKSGYYFLIDAAGSRLDGMVADNGQRLNFDWDGFWRGKSKIFSDRWTAEFAIPFQTLAFGKEGVWRANFERWRGCDRSRHRWTGIEREFRVTTVSEGGELCGFDDLEQDMGVELAPYLKVRRRREHDPRYSTTTGDFGGEFNWRITPQLAGSLTVNTDFAETEVDERKVNLSRFSLTFPEKRDFFLKGSTYFHFGWENSFGDRSRPILVPFFSRRIGLSPEGEEISIDYGARISGRVKNLDIGFLSVRTGEDSHADIPAGELIVARPAYRVNRNLTLGGILTHGNPSSRDSNTVGGGDIRYVSTDLFPGLLTFNAYFLNSNDEEIDSSGAGYGIRTTFKTSDWNHYLGTLYAQEEFVPALGHVYRPGERQYFGGVDWEPRPDSGPIRNFEFSFHPSFWTQPDGTIISKNLMTKLFESEWHSGDRFFIRHSLDSDRMEEAFEPVDGNVIPAGEYDWQTLEAGVSSSRKRSISGDLSYEAGTWYNGRTTQVRTSAKWNPSPNLELRLRYSQNRMRLPGGSFTTRVESMNLNYDFTPDIRLESLVQADSVSDNLGFQSRLKWIIEDGRELFFVVNSSWIREEDDSIVPVEHDLIVKLQYAFRF